MWEFEKEVDPGSRMVGAEEVALVGAKSGWVLSPSAP